MIGTSKAVNSMLQSTASRTCHPGVAFKKRTSLTQTQPGLHHQRQTSAPDSQWSRLEIR